MLNGNGNESVAKKSIGLNSTQKNNYVKLPSYMFYGGNVMCSCLLFCTAPHFHLGGRYHFSFSQCRYKISCFYFIKIHLFCFQSLPKSSSFSAILASVDIEI